MPTESFASAPDPLAVKRAVAVLDEAERPLVLAGNGVLLARAERELAAFVEETSIPVTTSAGGKGAVRETHPLALGVAGRYSRKVANESLSEADVVLVVGSSLGGLVTDGYRMPPAETRIVQIDNDVEQLGATRTAAIAIHADARLALAALSEEVRRRPLSDRHRPWVDEVERRVSLWQQALAAEERKPDEDGFVKGEAVIAALRDAARDDDLVVAGHRLHGCLDGRALHGTPSRAHVPALRGLAGLGLPGCARCAARSTRRSRLLRDRRRRDRLPHRRP